MVSAELKYRETPREAISPTEVDAILPVSSAFWREEHNRCSCEVPRRLLFQ